MAKLLLLVVIHIQVQKKHSIKIQTGVLHAFAILIFRSLQIALQIFKSIFSLNLQKIQVFPQTSNQLHLPFLKTFVML